MLHVLKQCEREIDDFPDEIREELFDAIEVLLDGQKLAMHFSRPMPVIARGVHELRFRDSSGNYRVIYFIQAEGEIYLIHAFKKKTQETPWRNLMLAKKRIWKLSK